MTKDGKRKKIYLYHQPRKTKKEGTVSYYSLAVCYKENGKNMKKVLQYLGRLSDSEADNYRTLLHIVNNSKSPSQLVDLQDIILEEEKNYFDSLIVSELWKQIGLDKVFSSQKKGNQSLTTEQVVKILTINRIIDPTSKIGTINWFQEMLLSTIMNIDGEGYTKNKVFNELPKIHQTKERIEELFWKFSTNCNASEFEVYYFDGSTSWFEGTKCKLSKYALEKTRSFYSHVVGLMLITDRKGYPVAWEVVEGNKKDSTEFKPLIERARKKYNIKEITYCFDRGVASIRNFNYIKDNQSKFISGIRDNQINKIFNLDKFVSTRDKILTYSNLLKDDQKGILPINGFYSANKKVFYRDLGVNNKMRHIVSFNVHIYKTEKNDRDRRIHQSLFGINKLNLLFLNRSKELDFEEAEKQLLEVFKKNKTFQFFSYTLKPIVTNNKIGSWRIEVKSLEDKIREASLTDGMMVYVTDHIEKKDKVNFNVSSFDIIDHYRNKYVVENAFRELKSFLDLRPFYVRTEDHVKAHYDIGIIAYFINNYIYEKLSGSDRNFEGFLKLIAKQFPKDIAILKKELKIKNIKLHDIIDCEAIDRCMKNVSSANKVSRSFQDAVSEFSSQISIRKFYKEVKRNSRVIKLVSPSGTEIYKMKPLAANIKGYLSRLNMASLVTPSIHTSLRIYQ